MYPSGFDGEEEPAELASEACAVESVVRVRVRGVSPEAERSARRHSFGPPTGGITTRHHTGTARCLGRLTMAPKAWPKVCVRRSCASVRVP